MHGAAYVIPVTPPADALAELDAAARALDELTLQAARLTLDTDEETRSLRIELHEGSGSRRLTPTQLLDLLAS